MSEQTPSNQPTAPGDPASGVQGGGEAVASKQPASNPTVWDRLQPHIRITDDLAPPFPDALGLRVVRVREAAAVAQAHAAAAVEPWQARVEELDVLLRDMLEASVAAVKQVREQLEARVEELERERDEAQARCREAAQTLIAAIGASEPEDVEITARRAAQRIAELEAAAEAAESALEFYREPTGYRLLWDPDDEAPPVIADEGATARDALKALRAALGKEADRG